MSDRTDDARPTRTDVPPRTTLEGRSFGNISYATEVNMRTDDLRRAAPVVAVAEVPAPRISVEQRNTGARKRVSGA